MYYLVRLANDHDGDQIFSDLIAERNTEAIKDHMASWDYGEYSSDPILNLARSYWQDMIDYGDYVLIVDYPHGEAFLYAFITGC